MSEREGERERVCGREGERERVCGREGGRERGTPSVSRATPLTTRPLPRSAFCLALHLSRGVTRALLAHPHPRPHPHPVTLTVHPSPLTLSLSLSLAPLPWLVGLSPRPRMKGVGGREREGARAPVCREMTSSDTRGHQAAAIKVGHHETHSASAVQPSSLCRFASHASSVPHTSHTALLTVCRSQFARPPALCGCGSFVPCSSSNAAGVKLMGRPL